MFSQQSQSPFNACTSGMNRHQCFNRANRPGRDAWKAAMRQRFNGWAGPAANIDESDDVFTISIYAAGIRKEAVAVTVKDDVLEVTYQPADAPQPDFANGREHTDAPWKRGFQLNNKVLTDRIAASYTDGVLQITLPKNPETNTKPVTVAVS